jgi:hypothetical protein
MKKLITLALVALITISCSTEQEVRNTDGCTCYKVYYNYEPVSYQGGTWVWRYVETSKELFSSTGDCPETDYIAINGGLVYRIECR